MDKLINPVMIEIDKLYGEYQWLKKIGLGADDGRQARLLDQASNLFDGNAPGFSSEEMINGFEHGSELLRKSITGMMVSEAYFHPDYLPVMKASVEEDVWLMNYLFILSLRDHLTRDELIALLKHSLHSHNEQVRWNSLIAVKEEYLPELEGEVQKLFDDSDSKIGRYAKRIAKTLRGK